MTDTHSPRLFARAQDIRAIGEAMLACTLSEESRTHEAHLSTCLWLLAERPDIDVDAEIGHLISRYNVSVGGVNDTTQGYHETIKRAFVAGIRACLARSGEMELLVAVNGLLAAPEGQRDWPLHFWSRALLFSTEARLGFIEPDLAPLPTV